MNMIFHIHSLKNQKNLLEGGDCGPPLTVRSSTSEYLTLTNKRYVTDISPQKLELAALTCFKNRVPLFKSGFIHFIFNN